MPGGAPGLVGRILPGQVLFDRYEVLRKLGDGGMGEVWLVRHLELDSLRALKLILPRFAIHDAIRVRFGREARVTARFGHPHIVVVHDAQLSGDAAFIEMEFIRGQSLNKLLHSGVPMPLDWVARILDQLCDALQVAHEHQVVHRDLKPSNLMQLHGRPPGEEFLKVLDFGIAKILDYDNRDSSDRTVTDDFIGTVPYASPEQLLGQPVDGRSDIYSTGVILYEMLTGFRPFGGTAMEQMHGHAYLPPPPLALKNPRADVPAEVERVVLRCLAKDPAQRPRSPRVLTEEFRTALARTTPGLPPRRSRVIIAGLAGVAMILMICLAAAFTQDGASSKGLDPGRGPVEKVGPSAPRSPGDRPLDGEAHPASATAARVQEIFRARCLECHGGSKTHGGVRILDRDLLLAKKKLIPGQPDASELFQRVTAAEDDELAMPPPPEYPRLGAEEVKAIRTWIAEGATPFPPDIPVPLGDAEYVLQAILRDVRRQAPADRPFTRYFSLNHLLAGGATAAELDLHRDALAKAINHLSWQRELVRPRPIEPTSTVYRVDLRALGWDQRPFECIADGKPAGPSPVNLFDLALLEYPYGVVPRASETFDRLAAEFLAPAGQVRPIPYVRADWFVSVATQPPLYEDFLRLPFKLKALEARLGVDAQADLDTFRAWRAGLVVSGVSRNNRVLQRHPMKDGAYWKSSDFRSSTAEENLFRDPIDLKPAGSEVIFNLPNGLQGYFLTDAQGNRLDAAPTAIVTDENAADQTVRNGLSCIRCHPTGVNGFTDAVRPAVEKLPDRPGFDKDRVLRLYPAQAEMEALREQDVARFSAALAQVLGRPPGREPLIPVSRQFLDGPLELPEAAAELGLAGPAELRSRIESNPLAGLGLAPLASRGVVRRDTWEAAYDRVIRHLGLGVPVVPLDGLTRRGVRGPMAQLDVELKTNRPNNVFAPGDTLEIIVANPGNKDLFIELIGTSTEGRRVLLTSGPTPIPAGQEYRTGSIKIRADRGKEQITVIACDTPFPAGVLLRGRDVADRVVHPLDALRRDGELAVPPFDPDRMVKETIEIETR